MCGAFFIYHSFTFRFFIASLISKIRYIQLTRILKIQLLENILTIYNKQKEMKKQQKLPNNRSTPPFLQFQTVRQCLRISLPEERMQELMGLRDMEDINTKRNDMTFRQFMGYHGKDDVVNQFKKKKKSKSVVKNKNKCKQIDTNHYADDDRLNSQFTDRKYKAKPFKKNKQPVQIPRPKTHKTVQKSIFDNIKYPENRAKSKQFLNLNNFSQCLYPKTQNFEQIYKIHSQRIKNNRSNNLQQHRQKIRTHRRGHSQLYQQITTKPQKSIPITTKNPNHNHNPNHKRVSIQKSIRLHSNLIKQICDNSLDSISEYRVRTNFTDQEGIVVNIRNKNIIGELYSSQEEDDNDDQHADRSIDSQDQYLLTMVSQDLKTIRNNASLISNPHKINYDNIPDYPITLPLTIQKLQVQNIKSQQIHIMHSEQEQQQKDNRVQNKIDLILQKIQQLKTIKKIEQSEKQQKQEDQESKKSSQFSNGDSIKQALDWNNQQPSLFQLEIILHNCLTLDQNQLETGRVKHASKKDKEPIPGVKMKKDATKNKEKKIFNTDDKWKQAKIKRIKKAQKLLKQGYLQATRILASSFEEDKSKIELDTHLQKYTEKRLKTNSHSMSHLQKTHSKSRPGLLDQYKDKKKQMQTIQLQKQLNHMPLLNDESQQLSQNPVSIIDEIQDQDNKKVITNPFLKLKQNGEELEEIVQIIIVDLCIQIIQDVQIGFLAPTDLFEKVFEIIRKNKIKRRIGFNSGALQVYIFLQKFGKFLQSKKTNNGDPYKKIIQNRIKQPIGPKPLELLKFMRQPIQKNDEQISQQQQSAFEEKQTFALSLSWFHEFSQQYISQYNFGIYYTNDEDRQIKRKLFLKNAMHVHNKAVFDSINQTIDKYRPYGLLGEPFPWKKYNKPAPINTLRFNKILNDTFEQVSLNCRFLCGIFIQQHITYKLNQFQFLEFKEDRLNKLLCQHINENQIRWTFIQDQETEMLVEIGRYVLTQLLKEVVRQMRNIGYERQEPLQQI